MYCIPADLDLREIVGSNLDQICLGRYDVQFRFGCGTVICVQSRATLKEADAIIAIWSEKQNWTTLEFQRLLNLSATSFSVPHKRLLEIQFPNALSLQLHDDSEMYESMQIYQRGVADGPIII